MEVMVVEEANHSDDDQRYSSLFIEKEGLEPLWILR
jgi:hypothetical protein